MPTLELEKLGVESLEGSDALSQVVGGRQASLLLYGSRYSLDAKGVERTQGGTVDVFDLNGGKFGTSLVRVAGTQYGYKGSDTRIGQGEIRWQGDVYSFPAPGYVK